MAESKGNKDFEREFEETLRELERNRQQTYGTSTKWKSADDDKKEEKPKR